MRGRFPLLGAVVAILVMALLLLSSSSNLTQASHEAPGADLNGETPPSDDGGSPLIIIIAVLATLAAGAGTAWILRRRLRRPGGPNAPN